MLFVDGLGIGLPDPEINPFFRASLPVLTNALGGRLPSSEDPSRRGPTASAFPLDATLGVEGIPQSGTGQVALLTGRNAPRILGRHFGPWPPVRLRPLLEEQSFLKRAAANGRVVVFANAYPRGYPDGVDTRRVAAPALAARAAGILDRDHEALAAGLAVASELTNEGWRESLGFRELPRLTVRDAGRNLAAIAGRADLTFFAHYQTDLVGHRGGMEGAVAALERLDGFLGGLLRFQPPDLRILLVSDHGNIEDVRVGHTRHPAMGMTIGPWPRLTTFPRTLTDIAPLVLASLEQSTSG